MKFYAYGSTGTSLALMQLALRRALGSELALDGVYGTETQEAVLLFQSQNALATDGVIGPETQRALRPYLLGAVRHRIQRGDTYWKLAQKYHSSAEAIAAANPDAPPQNLTIGETIIVPLDFDVVPTELPVTSELVEICVHGLTLRYPFLTKGEMGRSVMGKPLWTLTVGSGENRVLYNASHHANEWITTLILLRFAEELCHAAVFGEKLAGYEAKELLDYATLCLVPAVNPDGIDLVTGALTQGEDYRAARQIAAKYPQYRFPEDWKANIRGVDLNLQYPAGWEQARRIKFARGITSPAPGDFVGEEPLSEPESRAMADLTLRFSPALTLAYHTQGEVIFWRYGDDMPENSRPIADALSAVSGYAVETTPEESNYAGYKDWFLRCFRRPGYTIEAGRGRNPLPLRDFPSVYERNRGLLALAMLVT